MNIFKLSIITNEAKHADARSSLYSEGVDYKQKAHISKPYTFILSTTVSSLSINILLKRCNQVFKLLTIVFV